MNNIKNMIGLILAIIFVGGFMIVPALGLLWFSGIQYASFGALIIYIIKILLISLPVEALEKIVIHSFATVLHLSPKNVNRLDRILDFLTSLWIIHFIDEWSPNVTISTRGEIVFTGLLIITTIILDKEDQKNRCE